jgi:hypothetical protein
VVENDCKSRVLASTKDILKLSDDTEYLNRIYRYQTSQGKEEIFDRIRIIGGTGARTQASATRTWSCRSTRS